MLPAFVIRELLVEQPIVHFRLLKYRNFTSGIGLVAILGFVLYGSLVLLAAVHADAVGLDCRDGRHLDQPARGRHGDLHAAGGIPFGQGLGRAQDAGFRVRGGQHGVFRLFAR